MIGSLLSDADGVYHPRDHNDRLPLGLKGTMSEAELHILRGRLEAGRRDRARRGEYFDQTPIGYIRTSTGMALEPDEQERGVGLLVLDKFEEFGSAHTVLQFLRQEPIRPCRKNPVLPARGVADGQGQAWRWLVGTGKDPWHVAVRRPPRRAGLPMVTTREGDAPDSKS